MDGPSRPGPCRPPSRSAVAGNYFVANGIRVLRGRGIDRGDVERADPVVVINQALARAYFPQQDPIGQCIASSRPQSPIWLSIVSIAADTPSRTLVEPQRAPAVYMPMSIARGLRRRSPR
jgi:putative ABC transport system permease protein